MQNEDTQKILNTEGEPKAQTGNASNPTAVEGAVPGGPEGLLDKRADKYIREVAPIEDVPDDEDRQEAEQVMDEDGGATDEDPFGR